MKEKIELALVGCGGMAGGHIAAIRKLMANGYHGFRVSACCSRSVETAKKAAAEIASFQEAPPLVFDDVERLIASGAVQAVDVVLPHYLHHTIAPALLEGGMHVLLEKPLGITLKAGEKIIETARKHNRILATAENVRRDLPARACAWALTKEKMAGDVWDVDVRSMTYKLFDLSKPGLKWRSIKNLAGGGMILDSGAHFADMMLQMFGDVDRVSCIMATRDNRRIEDLPVLGSAAVDVEDTWFADIYFKRGLCVHWKYSRSFPGTALEHGHYFCSGGMMTQEPGITFHSFQSGGNIRLSNGKNITDEQIRQAYLNSLDEEEKARLFPYGSAAGVEEKFPHGSLNGFVVEIWDFIDAIRNERDPEITGLDGQRAKALCETCYESAFRGGEPVQFAQVLNGQIDAYQKSVNDFWNL